MVTRGRTCPPIPNPIHTPPLLTRQSHPTAAGGGSCGVDSPGPVTLIGRKGGTSEDGGSSTTTHPQKAKMGGIERSHRHVQSPTLVWQTRPIVGPNLWVKFGAEAPCEIRINAVNSKDIATRIDTHVADQLCNLWQGIILTGCRDISSQIFMNLAVARSLRVRCGPMWADVGRRAGLCAHIGRDLVKIWVRKLPFLCLSTRDLKPLICCSVTSNGKLSAVDQIFEVKGPAI